MSFDHLIEKVVRLIEPSVIVVKGNDQFRFIFFPFAVHIVRVITTWLMKIMYKNNYSYNYNKSTFKCRVWIGNDSKISGRKQNIQHLTIESMMCMQCSVAIYWRRTNSNTHTRMNWTRDKVIWMRRNFDWARETLFSLPSSTRIHVLIRKQWHFLAQK